MTFDKLAQLWLDHQGHLAEGSLVRYENALATVQPFFRILPKQDQQRMPALNAQVLAWDKERRTKLAGNAFNIEFCVLKSVFRFGFEEGYIRHNPMKGLRRAKVRTPETFIPTPDQFDAIVKGMRGLGEIEGADFIEFLAYSGCRCEEAKALRWRDVDFEKGRLLVGRGGRTKNGREYYLPLFPKLRLLLEAQRAMRPADDDDSLLWWGVEIRHRLDKVCRQLGLPHLHPHHAFRHYFAVQALKKVGVNNVAVVARWLNHHDGGALVLKTYANHIDNAEQEALAALL